MRPFEGADSIQKKIPPEEAGLVILIGVSSFFGSQRCFQAMLTVPF
jgi:hypothetical protein